MAGCRILKTARRKPAELGDGQRGGGLQRRPGGGFDRRPRNKPHSKRGGDLVKALGAVLAAGFDQ